MHLAPVRVIDGRKTALVHYQPRRRHAQTRGACTNYSGGGGKLRHGVRGRGARNSSRLGVRCFIDFFDISGVCIFSEKNTQTRANLKIRVQRPRLVCHARARVRPRGTDVSVYTHTACLRSALLLPTSAPGKAVPSCSACSGCLSCARVHTASQSVREPLAGEAPRTRAHSPHRACVSHCRERHHARVHTALTERA